MKRRVGAVLGNLAVSAYLALGASYAQQVLVIRGGILIDGNGGPPVPNATLVIEGQRIKEIRSGRLDPVPANATVIEADGKFFIPGLQDSHVHYRDWMSPMFIYNGITTIHDIGNSPADWILAQREMFREGKIVGPRLYAAVLNLWGRPREGTIAAVLPNMVTFTTATEARKWAQEAVALKADYHQGSRWIHRRDAAGRVAGRQSERTGGCRARDARDRCISGG